MQPTSLAALLCSHCPSLCVRHAAVELMTCALLLCMFCPGFRAAALLLAAQQLFTGVKCRLQRLIPAGVALTESCAL